LLLVHLRKLQHTRQAMPVSQKTRQARPNKIDKLAGLVAVWLLRPTCLHTADRSPGWLAIQFWPHLFNCDRYKQLQDKEPYSGKSTAWHP
jgi:hypothetical protein